MYLKGARFKLSFDDKVGNLAPFQVLMDKQKINYFIYARKSSEGADRQVLSIDGQLADLRKAVERDGLKVVDVYAESKSAKKPGNRPLFDDMIRKIKRGKANGIITWHTNRLSRNPQESGELQQLLQDGVIVYIMEIVTTLFRAKLTQGLADFWVAANAIKARTKIVI